MLADVNDLQRALEQGSVEPYFQPIVELRSGKLVGFEVLTRWRHEQLGFILPDNFIQLAETHGLLTQLMDRVLREAFRVSLILPDYLRLAFNLSAIQMQDESLPSIIRAAATQTGFPLHRLTVEITESAFVEHQVQAKKIASELKAMGCNLALDDFGTGYSSLHLQVLPFDELKIDRSFVDRITQTRENRKMVAAMIGLGHSLGMATIAEGVATEEQAQMLLWLGCRFGQGYLFGKPVAASEIAAIAAAPAVPLKPALGGGFLSLEAMPAQRLAQLQAIYDGASIGMAFLDLAGRYVNINRKLCEIHGIPVEAHLGRTMKEIVHPLLYSQLAPQLQQALRGEKVEEFELEGPGITFLVSFHPAWDEAGDFIGVSLFVVDITARKQMELELRERKEHFRCLVEHNPHTPWVCDADGNNLEVSPRWEEITGMSQEETRLRGWMRVLHPDDREEIGKQMTRALLDGTDIDLVYRVLVKSGEYRWMQSHGGPRLDGSGNIVRWYGSVWDIHDHKLAQEELLRLREELNRANISA